jgi:hypothetical protein
MIGLELLVKGQEYTVRDRFRDWDRLIFTGFDVEDYGWMQIKFACFDDCRHGTEAFFDITVTTNEVLISK